MQNESGSINEHTSHKVKNMEENDKDNTVDPISKEESRNGAEIENGREATTESTLKTKNKNESIADAENWKTVREDSVLSAQEASEQIGRLKEELRLVVADKKKLAEENHLLTKEIEILRNECIDREYENGLFIEDDVLKKIEKENCRLRNLVDGVYEEITNVWFAMVKNEIIRKE